MDGIRLKQLVEAGYRWLKQSEATVNAYNVYPVPDGDTGTNMAATMDAAQKAANKAGDNHAGRMAKAIANGALRGSRGNSGIILSQLWRGFAKSAELKEQLLPADLAAAFTEAAATAYGGVKTPVEGTILTVARETAEFAERLVAERSAIGHREFLRAITKECYASVQRTPEKLKILKDAGVIDSGGYGLWVIFDGMRRFVEGEPIDAPAADAVFVQAGEVSGGVTFGEEVGFGYDVQYLIYPRNNDRLDVFKVRTAIEAMGDCPLVTGDEEMIKVHVHVPDPGVPISYGASLGSLHDVVVEDMQAQSEGFLPGQQVTSASLTEKAPPVALGIVAVAAGQGLVDTFKSLGARYVIPGGQTMNPSVDDILAAIAQANALNVIVLPNNGNIVMTAQQAVSLSEIPARVVPTKTLPQGFGAMLAFNFEGDLDANTEGMTAAAGRVTTGEITRSTRNVTINDVSVKDGQVIGLINDKLAVAGVEVLDTTLALLDKAATASKEVITLYYGNGMTADEADAIAAGIREVYPDHVLDVYAGGQPHYYLVIGIE